MSLNTFYFYRTEEIQYSKYILTRFHMIIRITRINLINNTSSELLVYSSLTVEEVKDLLVRY